MLVAVASLVLLFVWGVHFSVFGSRIDLVHRPLAIGGFFFWLLAGSFGAGLMTGGVRGGLRFAFGMFLAFAIAFLFGWLRGNYS